MTAPSTAVSAAIPLAIVAGPIHDRAWWTEESARVGTGWPAVIDAALEIMVAGGILEPEPDTMTTWDAPSWRRAAVEYHRDQPGRLAVAIEPERLARLRRLMADDISLGRVWRELNDPGARPTPQTTVNALLYQLRMDGLGAFEHPNCRRRLAELSTEQLRELMAALIRVRRRCAAVTDELLIALDRIGRP
jgi:hypothetical protein